MHEVYKKRTFWLFVTPLLIIFTAFVAVPIVFCIYYSFTGYRGVGEAAWNNLANYGRLFKDRYVGMSIGNSLFSAASMLVILFPVSFLLAHFLNAQTRRNTVYKVVVFAPYVIPGVLCGLIWLFLLEPSNGLINNLLRAVGLGGFQPAWIGGKVLSPVSYALVCCWSSVGFYMAIWQMGLKSLPGDVLEASLIDGCGAWKQVFRITLPMLRESVVSIFIFILTSALKIYEVVYILTGGGPNHVSETIVSYMYSTTFESMLYGYGMTIAVVEFLLAMAITLLSVVLARSTKGGRDA